MKYYDGMGRDVTDYVIGLETRIQELTTTSQKAEEPSKAASLSVPIPEILGTVKEETPKPRRRKSVADTE